MTHVCTGTCPACRSWTDKIPVHVYEPDTNTVTCCVCGHRWVPEIAPLVVEESRPPKMGEGG